MILLFYSEAGVGVIKCAKLSVNVVYFCTVKGSLYPDGGSSEFEHL